MFPITHLFFSHLRSQRFLLSGNLDKVQHLWFIHIVPLFKMFHLCRMVLVWLLCRIPSLHSKYQDKFSHTIWHCNFVSLAVVYTIFKKYFSSYHISTWCLVYLVQDEKLRKLSISLYSMLMLVNKLNQQKLSHWALLICFFHSSLNWKLMLSCDKLHVNNSENAYSFLSWPINTLSSSKTRDRVEI